jgi:hypothetical protein
MKTDTELDSLLSKIKVGAKKHTGLRDDHDKLCLEVNSLSTALETAIASISSLNAKIQPEVEVGQCFDQRDLFKDFMLVINAENELFKRKELYVTGLIGPGERYRSVADLVLEMFTKIDRRVTQTELAICKHDEAVKGQKGLLDSVLHKVDRVEKESRELVENLDQSLKGIVQSEITQATK